MVLTCLKSKLAQLDRRTGLSPDQGNAGPFDHRTRGQARPKKREKTEPDLGKNTGPRLEP